MRANKAFFVIPVFILMIGAVAMLRTVFAVTSPTTQVTVANATPAVSAVVANGGNPITLVANSNQTVNVTFTVTDNNGCSDVFTGGVVTTTLYRQGVANTCTANSQNCYITTSTVNNCAGATGNATATFNVAYYAQPTDASSSYAAEQWFAYVNVKDTAAASGNATSPGIELNTLTAIDATPSAINYGTVPAGATSSVQTETVANVGNSTSTLNVSQQTILTSGGNTISVANQHFASTTFTFGGSEQALSASQAAVTGFKINASTNGSTISAPTYWALNVPVATPIGAYSGTNLFTAVWSAN